MANRYCQVSAQAYPRSPVPVQEVVIVRDWYFAGLSLSHPIDVRRIRQSRVYVINSVIRSEALEGSDLRSQYISQSIIRSLLTRSNMNPSSNMRRATSGAKRCCARGEFENGNL